MNEKTLQKEENPLKKSALLVAASIVKNSGSMIGHFVPESHLLKNPLVKESCDVAEEALSIVAYLPDLVNELDEAIGYEGERYGKVDKAKLNKIAKKILATVEKIEVSEGLEEIAKIGLSEEKEMEV